MDNAHLPPHSYESETMLVGSLLCDPRSINRIVSMVTPDDFYAHKNAVMFIAIVSLHRGHQPIDIETVVNELLRTGSLDEVGGHAAVTRYAVEATFENDAVMHAAIVENRARARRLVQLGIDLVQSGYQAGEAIDTAVLTARERIAAFAKKTNMDRGQTYAQALPGIAQEIEERWSGSYLPDVIPTGFHDLDIALNGGMYPGQLIIVGGRPGMAKTAFMMQLAHNMDRWERVTRADPRWAMVFSSEMTLAGIMWRSIAETTGIPSKLIKSGFGLSSHQKTNIVQQMRDMAQMNIWINDASRPAMKDVREQVERYKDAHDARLVLFDYIEQAGDEQTKGGNEEGRIAYVAAELKSIAKDCEVSMVGLSQVNRGVESRVDKMPTMADLRHSGRIEQEADIVILLYREDYYIEQGTMTTPTPGKAGTCDVIVAKNRDGERGVFPLKFVKELTAFRSL